MGTSNENTMGTTVASWLLVAEAGRTPDVRVALARTPAVECRGEAAGRLVVVTESPRGDLGPVHALLAGIHGVRDVALVAAFEDEDEA
jgi:nitrate reductase NapAB chaperone NapD